MSGTAVVTAADSCNRWIYQIAADAATMPATSTALPTTLPARLSADSVDTAAGPGVVARQLVCYESAIRQAQHSVTPRRCREASGGQQQREAELCLCVHEQVQYSPGSTRVQAGRGILGEHEPRRG